MSRLIDASALEARMYHDAFEVDSDMQKWDSGCWIRYKMFEDAIKEAPTIERKTGKWIFKEDFSIVDGYDWKCDQCGSWQRYISNYCPNCGSRMER